MAKAKEEHPLTPRQARFVEEYIVSLNATQAAIAAGYSERTANEQGSRLLAKVSISRAIASGKEARAKATGITAERVLEELAALAFSNHTHYEVDDDGRLSLAEGAPEGAHRAIASVKHRIHRDKDGGITRDIEFKLWDKPGAVKLAGRHVDVKGFFEKMEVTGKDGGPLSIEDARDPSRMTTKERDARMAELLAKGGLGSDPSERG